MKQRLNWRILGLFLYERETSGCSASDLNCLLFILADSGMPHRFFELIMWNRFNLNF
jgi:hypothetical protein